MPHKKLKRGRASSKPPIASSAPNTEMVIGIQKNSFDPVQPRRKLIMGPTTITYGFYEEECLFNILNLF